jgi:arylsulfatase A-like enzyme
MGAVVVIESGSEAGGRGLPVPRELRQAGGVFLGVCLAAALNGVLLLRAPASSGGQRFTLLLVDAASFLLLAMLASPLVWALTRSRLRRFGLLFLSASSLAVGVVTLHDDLEHFSQDRAGTTPAWLILASGTLVISLAVPASAWLATRAARFAYGALASVVLASALLIANGLLLPADYFGIHLYLAAVGTTVIAAALASSPAAWLARAIALVTARPRAQLWGAAAIVVGLSSIPLVAPLPARVKLLLARSESSAFYRLASRVRAAVYRAGGGRSHGKGEWFASRALLSPIAPSRPALVPPNAVIVMITIDALRADVINSGENDARFVNFARIRNESTWFSRAYSAATLTKLSLSALFMSKYFSQQYWTKAPDGGAHAPREDTSPRFPELLQKAGVHTLNFQSINWLHNGNGSVRGFDEETYVPYPKARNYYTPAPPIFDALLPALAKLSDKPAFVFSHLSDPHAPYTLGKRRGESPFEHYLAEVEWVDEQLGRLLSALDAPALRPRAVLIISADHGEAFDEHHSRTHGTTLYDETLHVPLMIRLPSREARHVDARVGLIDMGPTVLDLAGVDTPGAYMGQSLVGFLRGENPTLTRPLLAETRRLKSLITAAGLKVIVDSEQDRAELYDLNNDPHELDNIADSEELLAEPLAKLRQLFEVHRLRRPGYEPPFVR